METQVPDTFTGLFFGYFAFFAILCAYVFSLARRVKRLEDDKNS